MREQIRTYRMLRHFMIGVSVAFAMLAPRAAVAQITTFNFTVPPTSSVGNGAGNSKTWVVDGIAVTATAWSMDTTVSKPDVATLGAYSSGLGVTDKAEDGSAPYHTIDNVGLFDFVTLTFSRPVQILYGALVPFDVNSGPAPADNDAWVSFTYDPTHLPITNDAVWANLMLHATEVEGNLSGNFSTYLNPGMNTGDVWIVGADKFNKWDRDDGFKLAGLSVQLPVPEPATWLMMMLGFGLVGATLRRSRADQAHGVAA